ncbi:MAG: hypothetical protein KDA49_11405 [Rhodospirillaceae bacterium]|nr:hypothetical protein [Rhodospirillaceae bacterium]MCA8933067.1 hypothetical protein [Rhodospirillaceae bacterium]
MRTRRHLATLVVLAVAVALASCGRRPDELAAPVPEEATWPRQYPAPEPQPTPAAVPPAATAAPSEPAS